LPAVAIAGACAAVGAILAGYLFEAIAENHTPDWLNDLLGLVNPRPTDPLVIDLDGDGVELVARAGSNAYFDLDGDGFAEQTGWVKPDDGILAVDRNGNGTIDDISELFGSATQSGFDALKAFDTNNDGKVNAQDSGFGTLKIWRDLDGDGVSDAGELQSLTQAGISSISVTGTNASANIGGNQVVGVVLAGGAARQVGLRIRRPPRGGEAIGVIAESERVHALELDREVRGAAVVLRIEAIGLAAGGAADLVNVDTDAAQAVDDGFAR
jgi:hypothetical protein